MLQALEQLEAEHAAALRMLDHLDRAAALVASGVAVPAEIFGDLREFIEVFVVRCHQAKEDTVIFPALTAAGEASLVERFRAGHGAGRLLVWQVVAAIESYRAGDQVTSRHLAETARAYRVHLREHIAHEAAELFPVVARVLPASDAQFVAAFERIERDELGFNTHERLHHKLAELSKRLNALAAAAAM